MIKDFQPLYITGFSTLSALGQDMGHVWNAYLSQKIGIKDFNQTPVAALKSVHQKQIEMLRLEQPKYKRLDKTTLMAIIAARKAIQQAQWKNDKNIAVNLSSSRGATALFEQYYEDYLSGNISPLTSPTTTLGNLSSWVAQDMGLEGFAMSHSITCSSALHAILNAYAWIQGGLTKRVIAGASEAPLTPFTIAQMKAIKIYSKHKGAYPCTPLIKNKLENDFVLGEGCGVFCIENSVKKHQKVWAKIAGIGFANEQIQHATAIHPEGEALYQAMRKANPKRKKVDAIILHAPGTISGEQSELRAVNRLFPKQRPYVYTNKFQVGHTFAAAGALNMELALLMLEHQSAPQFPYDLSIDNPLPKTIRRVLVNAIGFGGNAVSILLEHSD